MFVTTQWCGLLLYSLDFIFSRLILFINDFSFLKICSWKTRCLFNKSGEKKEVISFMKKPTVSFDAAKDCVPLESFFPKEEEKKEKTK